MNRKIIIILLIALSLTGCQSKNEIKEDKFKTIFIEKKENCDNERSLYYTDNNVNYYTVCLNKITLKYDNSEIELKDAIKKDTKILDEIKKRLTITDVIYDGGTTIYKDFGYSEVVYSEMGNVGFTMISCNAMNSKYANGYNKDYYFGGSIEYDGYCSN